jgi:tetratricopeptide (TPR) repeat protein
MSYGWFQPDGVLRSRRNGLQLMLEIECPSRLTCRDNNDSAYGKNRMMARLKILLTTFAVSLSLSSCDDQTGSATRGTQTPDLQQFHETLGIEQLQRHLQQNPGDFAALSKLGDLYFESGSYLFAIQTYDRALAIEPGCADCLNDKGLAQFYSGDPEGALSSLALANQADPSYPHAWLSRGYVLMSVGRYEEAMAPLQQVKTLDSTGVLAAEADRFLAMIEEKRGTGQ